MPTLYISGIHGSPKLDLKLTYDFIGNNTYNITMTVIGSGGWGWFGYPDGIEFVASIGSSRLVLNTGTFRYDSPNTIIQPHGIETGTITGIGDLDLSESCLGQGSCFHSNQTDPYIDWNKSSGISSNNVIFYGIDSDEYDDKLINNLKVFTVKLYSTPTINITSPVANTILDKDKNMTLGWDSWTGDSGSGTVVEISINNSTWSEISGSGNSAGTYSFIPARYAVSAGSSFTVKVRRKHKNTGIYSTESSRQFRTYSIPTITNLKILHNPVNANTVTQISWDLWTGTYNELSTVYIQINGSNWINCGSSNKLTTTLQEYVPFENDNQNITITAKRVHTNTLVEATQSITVKVLYTPIKQINNLLPNPIGTVASDNGNIKISWSYPYDGQYGIVSRYDIILSDPAETGGKTVTYSTTNQTCNIIITDLTPMISYAITIYPVYTDNISITSRGPGYTMYNYIKVVSKLNTPTIEYPITNNRWWKATFRIAFKLPSDPDYNYLLDEIKQSYLYSDIEVKINGQVRSLLEYPEAFSLLDTELAYEAPIVINPILANYIYSDSVEEFRINVRVKKKYIDNNLDIAWSDWSETVVVNNIPIIYPDTSQGNEILAEHIGIINNEVVGMCRSYINTNNIIYDFIRRGDFENLYNKMIAVIELINNYSDYNSERLNVKFKRPEQFDVWQEQIESSGKRNYFKRIVDYLIILTT